MDLQEYLQAAGIGPGLGQPSSGVQLMQSSPQMPPPPVHPPSGLPQPHATVTQPLQQVHLPPAPIQSQNGFISHNNWQIPSYSGLMQQPSTQNEYHTVGNVLAGHQSLPMPPESTLQEADQEEGEGSWDADGTEELFNLLFN